MANIQTEFTLQELQELHVTMVVRQGQLQEQIAHKSPEIAAIAIRQLERVRPITYYIESVLREQTI